MKSEQMKIDRPTHELIVTLPKAAGFGEFDPVAPNDTPDHQAQNRRIEIVLQPNLSELPSLDGLPVPAGK